MPRFRLQFRVRTLLISVFLLGMVCAWVSWQISFVKARKALLAEIAASGGFASPTRTNHNPPLPYEASVPWCRRLLGDKEIWLISGLPSSMRRRVSEIQQLFPEADFGPYAFSPNTFAALAEVKSHCPFVTEWKEWKYDGKDFVFGLSELPTSGESYIEVLGWVHNEHFHEWRRVVDVDTRGLGAAKLHFDAEKGVVTLCGAANNDFRNVEVLRFDLRATSNDAGYNN